MRPRSVGRTILAVVAGVILGTSIMVAAETLSEDDRVAIVEAPQPSAPSPPAAPRREPVRTVLLAWTPGGLPASAERSIEAIAGVRDATTVVAGLEWIRTSEKPDGTRLDPPPGLAIPFEVAVVEPGEYARFVSPSEAPIVAALRPGEILMPDTGQELRDAGRGLRIVTTADADGGTGMTTRTVTGVISDRATNGYEALVAAPAARDWSGSDRFVLAHLRASARPRRIERRVRSLLDPGRRLRVRLQGESPFLRYGDAVLPQLIIKQDLGEFAARPTDTGALKVDERWRRSSIRAAAVPILGTVTCHRRLFPRLRSALTELRSAGLAYLVDPGDYGGCYSPRFVGTSSSARLSHHSWGMAIDVNVAENAFGTKPDQDPRVVRIFEKNGFTWGGRWLIPDGMHFEWARFP